MKRSGMLAVFFIPLCLFGALFSFIDMPKESPAVVYAFSGENEFFSLVNGVIVLTGKEAIIYGGTLIEKGEQREDIVSSSMHLYLFDNGQMMTLSSFDAVDMTNTGFSLSDPGNGKGQLSEKEQNLIADHLYFDLAFTQQNGEASEYQIKLDTTNVTAIFD